MCCLCRCGVLFRSKRRCIVNIMSILPRIQLPRFSLRKIHSAEELHMHNSTVMKCCNEGCIDGAVKEGQQATRRGCMFRHVCTRETITVNESERKLTSQVWRVHV